MAAASGDEGHGETGMDVINTGDLLWRRLGAASVLIRGFVVVHDQFLYLNKSLNDWYDPEVSLWDL